MPAHPRPLLLGHRGARASANVTENTIAAFELCLEHGCDGFEFDVRSAGSGVVVCHDETFRGLTLASAPAGDLAAQQALGFLPTLEQVLRNFASRCFLDIEIKDPGLESLVLDLLQRYRPERGYVITSFLPEVLQRLRDLSPKVELGLIWDEPAAPWQSILAQWALPERRLLNPELAAQLLGADKRIGTWTANSATDMVRLAGMGAEMLISDETARLANTFRVS